MQKSIQDKTSRKIYNAVLCGRLPNKTHKVDLPLKKNQGKGNDRQVVVDMQDGKAALSFFDLMQSAKGLSLARVDIRTGRTHQIRVHAAALGFPILGDKKYGDWQCNRHYFKLGAKRLYLHAREIELDVLGRKVKIEAPLPPEFEQILQQDKS